ncbi:hypothetical protein DERF_006266 [Dermatophagoides farinae]|uniref:Uncharacterized protein n=1 Tax=Dermatophagoides farinae TaxID=6954 RepID=A0A922L9I8_DERFA|nr:hypothetical protein DERF_006266 [Dermatophagoides farinae]
MKIHFKLCQFIHPYVYLIFELAKSVDATAVEAFEDDTVAVVIGVEVIVVVAVAVPAAVVVLLESGVITNPVFGLAVMDDDDAGVVVIVADEFKPNEIDAVVVVAAIVVVVAAVVPNNDLDIEGLAAAAAVVAVFEVCDDPKLKPETAPVYTHANHTQREKITND